MDLVIKQHIDRTETVSSSFIDVLYQLTKPDSSTGQPAANAVLVGRIQSAAAYEDAVNFLNTQFSSEQDNGSDFQITVLNNNYYIRFEDPEVVRVLTAQGIIEEGEGLTIARAKTITLPTSLFYNNVDIEYFDELYYFDKIKTGVNVQYMFENATNLKSVDLTGVQNFNSWHTFNGCTSLEWFHGKSNPKNILNLENLSAGLKDNTFQKCYGLYEIQSLGVINKISASLFRECINLEYVNLPLNCSEIGDYSFYSDSKLSTINLSQVTTIGISAFNGCSSLEYCVGGGDSPQGELNLPNLTGTLGNNAFRGCVKLTSIASLGSITSIGDSAFENCTNLVTINIPSTVISIGNNAFNGTVWYNNQPDGEVVIGRCLYKYKGTYVGIYTIPSNVLGIAAGCFYGQSSLTGITSWPSGQDTIPDACFQNSGLESFDLTGIVKTGINAFRNSKLTSIVIPNSVTTLGDDCFSQCSDLSSVTIGTGVTSLGRNIFSLCTSLETLVIPSNVKSLERDTLQSCNSLQWVRLESTTMVSLNNVSCFNNTNNCIIYVPSDLVDSYKADSKWSSLADRIQAIPTA